MCLTGKKRFAALFAGILAGTIALTSVYAATEKDSSNSGSVIGNTTNYISTNRDTRLPEEPIEIKEQSVADYEKLYETDSAIYYFRDDRDVIAVYDKESGYLWKTGLDSGIGKDLKKQARKAETEEEFDYFERNPIEENLNEVYTHFANSLVSIEYIKGGATESTKKASSSDGDSVSGLSKLAENKYCLTVDFAEAAIQLKVYITFGEKEITYDIPYEEITGEGKTNLCDLYLTPFLGSSGGEVTVFNRDKGKYDETMKKDAPSGYVLLPDGSGALVRFRDNAVSFQTYVGDVYGADVSQGEYYHRELTDAIALKEPVMPVFGVAYGNNQVAFVAYAESGDEYMSICLTPEENVTYYTWVTPKFNYNSRYHQVYNKAGSGFFTMLNEARNFDITMTYEFLTGDGSGSTEAANYSGMALTYRNHLIEMDVLTEQEAGTASDMPIRLDFIMSDSESNIVGTKNVVVTTAQDVHTILENVVENGITNINSGLYGWQKKGVSIAKPYTQKFSSAIGTKAQFKNLFEDFAAMQVDISYGQDYVTINELMMNYYQNAVRHMSSWYIEENRESLLPDSVPTAVFGYAAPDKSAEWLLNQFETVKEYSSSMSVQGIGSVLTGNYISKDEIFTVSDTKALFQETLGTVSEEVKLNIENPHKYLWQYVDRYLQAPVGHSQYIFETDAVPFLQMVLSGTMEVYGPYSNFSFYTQKDILKMIDYNIAPSFILSMDPSYKLADTASCDLYSTEYSLYEELIQEVYNQVNLVWKEVHDYNWISRSVVADGVVVNTYENNGLIKEVIINYTLNDITYKNATVGAESALVLE